MCPDEFLLTLADGTSLTLRGADEYSRGVVSFLAQAARLSPAPSPLPWGTRRVLVADNDGSAESMDASPCDVLCAMAPLDVRPRRRRRRVDEGAPPSDEEAPPAPTPEQRLWGRLMRLSGAAARETHPRGGAMLHGGLVEMPSPAGNSRGDGMLLAGRSGVGKTTACSRVPPPWRCLCDDVTLVVRNLDGAYHAHPWPTWSRLLGPDKQNNPGAWHTQTSVPLRAIFILEQGDQDNVEPLGPGHAVCLLSELARQPLDLLMRGMKSEELGPFYRQLFENLCALVKAVPCYTLWVSRDGPFWNEIVRALGSGE